ncbi:uncharacterized protein FIBRA_08722 [Fibroporia radiculosa]|uniref:Cytochrome P450 n=1 Tax=Fibroporia radiculosa TaxID=599839 RepID=J4GI45_9APHY|nr:uncharacterized protein FIBRA_08722 [Fibroporia radiculosa]CCM06458.1 predicted protein [Fibroporia radiculosa]
MPADYIDTTVFGLLLLFILLYGRYAGRKVHTLPPGPKRIPIFGNLYQLPLKQQAKEFQKWAENYGDIFYFDVFGQPALVVNSMQAAFDLMDKRGSKYSDRPRTVVLTELSGFDPSASLLPYGNQWRQHRKWFTTAFQTKSSLGSYKSLEEKHVRRMLAALIDTPARFMFYLKRSTAATILDIAYGYTVSLADDEYVERMDSAIALSFGAGNAGSTLIDFFPVLRHIPSWMPGMGVKRKALEASHSIRAMHDDPYNRVKNEIELGSARPSFLASHLKKAIANGALTKELEYNLKGASALIYIVNVYHQLSDWAKTAR